jgi:hypothetical protein
MNNTKNIYLNELYNFIVKTFSFELVYCFKIWFENCLCQVSKKHLQKKLFVLCQKKALGKKNSLPSVKQVLSKKKFFAWYHKKTLDIEDSLPSVFLTLDKSQFV